jgi:hypothetical protein
MAVEALVINPTLTYTLTLLQHNHVSTLVTFDYQN